MRYAGNALSVPRSRVQGVSPVTRAGLSARGEPPQATACSTPFPPTHVYVRAAVYVGGSWLLVRLLPGLRHHLPKLPSGMQGLLPSALCNNAPPAAPAAYRSRTRALSPHDPGSAGPSSAGPPVVTPLSRCISSCLTPKQSTRTVALLQHLPVPHLSLPRPAAGHLVQLRRAPAAPPPHGPHATVQ